MVQFAPGSVVPAFLSLLTSMVFTRVFTATEYGAFGLALAITMMAKQALSSWLTLSIAKFLPPEAEPAGQKRVKGAVALSLIILVLVEIPLGVLAIFVAPAVMDASVRELLVPVVVLVVVLSAFEVVSTVFAAERRANEFVAFQVIVSIATFGLRLVLVYAAFRGNVAMMFWSMVIANGVLLPSMWSRAGLPSLGNALRRIRTPETVRLSRSFLAFGLPMTLWLFASMLMDVADRFIINLLEGPAAVGIYDANYRLIVGVVALMIVPISMTLHPYLMSVSGAGSKEHVSRVLGAIVDNMLIMGTLAVGVTYVFSEDLGLLLGPAFREGSVIMPIVLAGVFAFNIGYFAHKPFEITGRTRPMVLFAYLGAGVNIALNFALIPVLGYIGAAWATFLSYCLYCVCTGLLGRSIYPWRLDVRRTFPVLGLIGLGVTGIVAIRNFIGDDAALVGFLFAVGASGALGVWVLLLIRRGVADVQRQELPTEGTS